MKEKQSEQREGIDWLALSIIVMGLLVGVVLCCYIKGGP